MLEKVWRNYISSFEFFIKLRETEKKHSEKKISGLEKEIKALKDKVRQMEKDKLQRKDQDRLPDVLIHIVGPILEYVV